MQHFTTSKPRHFSAFRSAAEEVANAIAEDEWANEDGHMHAVSGYIVRTPNAAKPFKVVFDHGDGPDTYEACTTMNECRARIRRGTRIPLYVSPVGDQGASAL